MPLKHVQRKIQDYLCNGEPIWQIRSRGGRARILVGHGLDHDLKCLEIEYPAILIRQAFLLYRVMIFSNLWYPRAKRHESVEWLMPMPYRRYKISFTAQP